MLVHYDLDVHNPGYRGGKLLPNPESCMSPSQHSAYVGPSRFYMAALPVTSILILPLNGKPTVYSSERDSPRWHQNSRVTAGQLQGIFQGIAQTP